VTGDLERLTDDQLVGEMRRRDHGLVYAPRPPFHVGVVAGDDVAVPVAWVIGPQTRRAYAWRDGAITDEAGRTMATVARAGRVSIDARALADAAFADATAGPWVSTRSELVRETSRYLRVVPGFTIGRGLDTNLRMQSGTIARHHCRFAFDGRRWFVEDLRSTNGTYIDRTRVRRAALDARTRIEIAGHSVEFMPTLSPPRRSIDPTDPAVWAGLYLDRIELDLLTAALVSELPEVPPLATTCARMVAWMVDDVAVATDARWLMPTADDAGVWFDALVEREGDELPAPIFGDDCACFAAGDGAVILARTGALVARLAVVGSVDRVDDLAGAMAVRMM
jgi:hypothetical protein